MVAVDDQVGVANVQGPNQQYILPVVRWAVSGCIALSRSLRKINGIALTLLKYVFIIARASRTAHSAIVLVSRMHVGYMTM